MRSQFTCTLSDLCSTPLEVLQMRLRASAAAEQTAERLAAWDDTLALLRMAFAETAHERQFLVTMRTVVTPQRLRHYKVDTSLMHG